MSEFRPCIIIPVYNHGKACINVVKSLSAFCQESSVKIILVDDGNGPETKNCLNQIIRDFSQITELVTLEKNSGKGGAFIAGLLRAEELGYTHALQLDADGQHDTGRCKFFLKQSQENPDALVCGFPEYDETAPGHRKNGRWFANTWCAIVSWKGGIKDSMCGFRVYPVEKTARFCQRHFIDKRMGFDIEILVKLIWTGMPVQFFPVKVTYPSDGISNFHVVRDNIRISWVFTKLCCGMFLRSPLLLWRKINGR